MAHLWVQNDDNEWSIVPLERSNPLALNRVPTRRFNNLKQPRGPGPILQPVALGRKPGWALLLAEQVVASVNGIPVRTGIKVLSDRDEVHLARGATFFFSTEESPTIESASEAGDVVMCARCCDPIESGDSVVRCPGCGRVHHQNIRRPCWIHVDHCTGCPQPTTIDGQLAWSPEDL